MKFSKVTLSVKAALRTARLNMGHDVNEGAKILGVSRKKLEDIEATRSYGCYISLEILAKAHTYYDLDLDDLLVPPITEGSVANCSYFAKPVES